MLVIDLIKGWDLATKGLGCPHYDGSSKESEVEILQVVCKPLQCEMG